MLLELIPEMLKLMYSGERVQGGKENGIEPVSGKARQDVMSSMLAKT